MKEYCVRISVNAKDLNNDADFIENITDVSEIIHDKIIDIIDKIKKCNILENENTSHVYWPSESCLTSEANLKERSPKEIYNLSDEEFEIIEDLFPFSVYGFDKIISLQYWLKNEVYTLV